MTRENFLKGAVILSIAGGISKMLGAIYRIPLARLIGDEGMGLYQMAYPIYITILALATAGIPVAISVIVSRKQTEGFTGDIKKLFRSSLVLLFFLGIILSFLLAQSAYFLANYILEEPRAYYPILAVAPAIFFAALMSVFRGYFQGYQTMVPTAVSQVFEQLFRVCAVVLFAYLLIPYGLEYAAAGATFGAVVGGITGLIVLIIFYIRYSKREKMSPTQLQLSGISSFNLSKEMMKLAIPVSVGAVVFPLVQMLDAVIVPSRLIAIEYTSSQATALFGQLGMAAVLIGLPTIFTIAIATSLVPAISEAKGQNDKLLLQSRLNYGFRAGMIVALPCAGGLFILAYPISDLLYGIPQVGFALEPLAFSAIALAAFQISSAGLQGIGKPQIAMRNLVVAGAFKVLFNYTLTAIPALNIQGAAIGTVVAFSIGAILNLIFLKKLTGVSYEIGRLIKITITTILMVIGVKTAFDALIMYGLGSNLATILAIFVGIAIYGVLLFLLREIDINMIKRIIKGV
ncbi:Stage V sporulation protein [Candidatus Syntrophocurvum alkaliphilum]|uniref:Stage V sporulation protein n=1 Tax=Candidatus Syntrophocurvum alkaliphilum TaxID=2293317 RepID=A0A6I6DIL2_9FIRM|nr:polysaccharide biosynthesis protein [Candidatus Syntrophocurvum alkaliphilum]QGU00529.1 Stage V sporulation protein [Candidatus Syntrophocurvum alkaliphilum]